MGGESRGHAVVIGASIAGLCAARVLSDFYDQVTIFERDELPSTPANRTAVPQGRHVHLLMARGAMEFEGLFPGLLDGMVAAGVPILENRPDCIHFGAAGHVLGTGQTLRDQFTAYVPSRPQLEWQIRRRVCDIDNVEIQHRSVAQPRFDFDAQRVTGVLLDSDADEPDFVAADLVVDAAGRGTRLPVWLQQWGYQRPPEKTVDVGIGYASHQLRLPDGAIRERVIVAGASREQPRGLGLLGYEDGTWTLTTFGVAKVEPPHTFPEMLALANTLLPERIATALQQAEPVGEVAFHRYPVSRWRRYHELDRFPAGILPLGDAVASFDPTYGQGMTMTSLQAGHLRRALAGGAGEDLVRKRKSCHRQVDVSGVDDDGDRRPHLPSRDRGQAVVVRPGGQSVRPVPRGGRDRSCSRRMVFASVLVTGQPLHGPVGEAGRPHYSAQHATLARRAPSWTAGTPRRAGAAVVTGRR